MAEVSHGGLIRDALILIVFAGSELFTGHTMYMVFGKLQGLTSWSDLIKIWLVAWLFNLIGSAGLACLFVYGGGGAVLANGATRLLDTASYKIHSSVVELLARATLFNWLVCLALWMSARTSSDTAKVLVISWCLFAFIASGYEHSVANMTQLSIALLADHSHTISLSGMAYNLAWVTVGNIFGGSLFMGLAYWLASYGALSLSFGVENDNRDS